MYFAATRLLLIVAACAAAGALWHVRFVFLPASPERRGKGIRRAVPFLLAASFLAASAMAFHHLGPPIRQAGGKIREVAIRYTGENEENRTEIFFAPDDLPALGLTPGQSLGLAANGTDRHFFAGQYAVIRFKPNGEIIEAEFRDFQGRPQGRFRSSAVAQPYFPLLTGLVALFFALKGSRRDPKAAVEQAAPSPKSPE